MKPQAREDRHDGKDRSQKHEYGKRRKDREGGHGTRIRSDRIEVRRSKGGESKRRGTAASQRAERISAKGRADQRDEVGQQRSRCRDARIRREGHCSQRQQDRRNHRDSKSRAKPMGDEQ
jgi:hypothetical protein